MPSSVCASARAATCRGAPRRGLKSVRAQAVSGAAAAGGADGVTIRRRPPHGTDVHGCGSDFNFKVETVTEGGAYVANTENQPRNILEEIVWSKDAEIRTRKDALPLHLLKNMLEVAPPVRSFPGALRAQLAATGQPGLIAEVKKASPSRGLIQPNFDPVEIALGYEAGGAACCSVLCDEKFFQGSYENLKLIRAAGVECPLLCKEFIVEAYQIFLARAKGADAILLIAAVLPNQDLTYLMKVARSLGMSCLIEVHTERELKRVLLLEGLEMVGVNNRDLETFAVDLGCTNRLLGGEMGKELAERGVVCVGESGISEKADVDFLREVGIGAVLVGESLVKQDSTQAAVEKLFGQRLPTLGETLAAQQQA